MKRTYVEVSCDSCGCCCHYHPGSVNEQARAEEWIITADGRHYDSEECYRRGKAERASAVHDCEDK